MGQKFLHSLKANKTKPNEAKKISYVSNEKRKLEDLKMRNMWFYQDGAASHTARETIHSFPGDLISRSGDVYCTYVKKEKKENLYFKQDWHSENAFQLHYCSVSEFLPVEKILCCV